MRTAKECVNLEEIREGIDDVDAQIVAMIGKRAEFVKEAAKFKKSEKAVRDPQRVQKVIASKKELAVQVGAPEELVQKIYTVMIDWFVEAELREWGKI
jgi:isochorismate pyruvate lyase